MTLEFSQAEAHLYPPWSLLLSLAMDQKLNMFKYSLNYIFTKDFFCLLFRWFKMTPFPWTTKKNSTHAVEGSIGYVTQRSQQVTTNLVS